MRSFYLAWPAMPQKTSQVVRELATSAPPAPIAELPWGHNRLLLTKLDLYPCVDGSIQRADFQVIAHIRVPHNRIFLLFCLPPCKSVVEKRLEAGRMVWEFPRMKTLTVDDRQRIRLPKVKAGQVFAYEPNSDGTIKLVPVVPKPGPKRIVAKLVKRKGGLFFLVPTGYTLDPEAIGQAVTEERDSRS
jgi:hypothetical protein